MKKKLLFLDGYEKNKKNTTTRGATIQYAVAKGLIDKDKSLSINIVSNVLIEWARCSKYIDKYFHLNKVKNDKDYLENILDIIQQNNITMIFPISEQGIRYVLENKEVLSKKCLIATMPSYDTFNLCTDKWKMHEVLSKEGVPLPQTEKYDASKQYDHSYFPRLFKPCVGDSGKGIFIAKRGETKKTIESMMIINQPYIMQEYIEGYDIDCSVLCKEGKILLHTIQFAHTVSKGQFNANTIKLEFLHNEAILELVKKTMQVLNFSGIAHIDLRYDEINNRYVLIEINPRYWGSLHASLAVGIDFPYQHYLMSNNNKVMPQTYKESFYVYIIPLLKDIFTFRFNYVLAVKNRQFLFTDICFYKIKLKKYFHFLYN